MAGKKGVQVQLQAELNNDEDWEEFLQRSGLLIIDVYSDWCGPCTALVAYLKKLKLDLGGDNMNLAIAKCDNITCLERFRNRSEPTWLFVAKQKRVNLLFGSNVPKLIQTIIQEMELEMEAQKGNETRVFCEIDELTSEEFEAQQLEVAKKEEIERIELEEAIREGVERHNLLFSKIATKMVRQTVVIVWPQVQEIAANLNPIWEEHKISLSHIDRPILTETKIETWIKYGGFDVSDLAVRTLGEGKSLVWLLKLDSEVELEEPIEQFVAKILFGESRKPLGDEGCLAEQFIQKRYLTPEEIAEQHQSQVVSQNTQTVPEGLEVEPEVPDPPHIKIPGVWTPLTPIAKATVTHTVFPKQTTSMLVPLPDTLPPHILVMFEAFKRREVHVLDLVVQEFPEEILHYGFFTGPPDPKSLTLAVKNLEEFDLNIQNSTYDEKLALAVVKTRLEPIEALLNLGPVYVSENTVVGKMECDLLFPDDYEPKPVSNVQEVTKPEDDPEVDENGEIVAENGVPENPEIATVEEE